MKLTDDIIEKFGFDCCLHFSLGGWIVSLFSGFGWIGLVIGIIVMEVLSYLKEEKFDDVFDKKDIIAANLGGAVAVVGYALCQFFLWIF